MTVDSMVPDPAYSETVYIAVDNGLNLKRRRTVGFPIRFLVVRLSIGKPGDRIASSLFVWIPSSALVFISSTASGSLTKHFYIFAS